MLEDGELLQLLDSTDPEYRFAAAAGFINQEKDAKTSANFWTKPEPIRTRRCEPNAGRHWAPRSTRATKSSPCCDDLKDVSVPRQERVGALAGLGQLIERAADSALCRGVL